MLIINAIIIQDSNFCIFMIKKLAISVGVIVYNEENNIEKLLDSLLHQKLKSAYISEIIVVSSGSTDNTNRIVNRFIRKNKIIKLICQKKRLGKASAVNLFLSNAKQELLILSSGDILLKPNTIDEITKSFKEKNIGIVGSHPIPLNDPKTFFGFTAHLLWNLHHSLSLNTPKMGEFIAFRKVFKQIPNFSSVDEANIEALIRGQGYKAVYAPNAIIYNKGADNLNDFLNRRRHIYAGHLATKYEYSYEVSTINIFRILHVLLINIQYSWRFFLWTPAVIILEGFGRFLGLLDYKLNLRTHTVWEITPSTKSLPQLNSITE